MFRAMCVQLLAPYQEQNPACLSGRASWNACQLVVVSAQIVRTCGEKDRALLFRAWSRLCLHAASLSAAEGASASATAMARAARAEAMEKEAEAAADKAEAWRRAAAASAEVAAAREKALREASRGSVLTAELQQTKEEMEQVARQQQLRRVKILVRGYHSDSKIIVWVSTV